MAAYPSSPEHPFSREQPRVDVLATVHNSLNQRRCINRGTLPHRYHIHAPCNTLTHPQKQTPQREVPIHHAIGRRQLRRRTMMHPLRRKQGRQHAAKRKQKRPNERIHQMQKHSHWHALRQGDDPRLGKPILAQRTQASAHRVNGREYKHTNSPGRQAKPAPPFDRSKRHA